MRSMLAVRGILIVLTATLGVVLLARGNVVVGALLLALAVGRAVTVAMRVRHRQRRREQRRERMAAMRARRAERFSATRRP